MMRTPNKFDIQDLIGLWYLIVQVVAGVVIVHFIIKFW